MRLIADELHKKHKKELFETVLSYEHNITALFLIELHIYSKVFSHTVYKAYVNCSHKAFEQNYSN